MIPTISEQEYQQARKHHDQGMVFMQSRQYKKAIDKFSEAVAIFPEWHTAFLNRGLAYYYLNQFDKALSDCNRAIQLKPDYAKAYYNRGLVHVDTHDYQQALEDFSYSIDLDSDNALAFLNRGLILFQLGQKDVGVADIANAVKMQPELTKSISDSEIIDLIHQHNRKHIDKAPTNDLLVTLAISVFLTYGGLYAIIKIVDGINFQNGYIIFISAVFLAAVHPLLNYFKIENMVLHTIVTPASFLALFLLPSIQFSNVRQLLLATVYYWVLSYIVVFIGAALYVGYSLVRKGR